MEEREMWKKRQTGGVDEEFTNFKAAGCAKLMGEETVADGETR